MGPVGPVGPRWGPCRPHEPCYLGRYPVTKCLSTYITLLAPSTGFKGLFLQLYIVIYKLKISDCWTIKKIKKNKKKTRPEPKILFDVSLWIATPQLARCDLPGVRMTTTGWCHLRKCDYCLWISRQMKPISFANKFSCCIKKSLSVRILSKLLQCVDSNT